VRDVDWMIISGPSLLHTERDVVLLRTSASDAMIDLSMDQVAENYTKGGRVDLGVPGVRAVRSFADGAERIIVKPKPHVLAVVPPSVAPKVARQLARAAVPAHIRRGEAVFLRVVNPHHPMPEVPASITVMSLRVVPRDDGGADVYLEGQTPSPEAASAAADQLKDLVARRNTFLVSAMTHGLLDRVEASSDGSVAKLHDQVSRDQIATLVSLVAGFLGVSPAPRGAAPGSSALQGAPR